MSKEEPDMERIARRLARAGVASRREAERMIEAGRVRVNGKRIDSPALNVGPGDKVEVDGKPLAAPEPPRMWRYYKPLGLVTSERDEKGRPTVFERLPPHLPRVVSVGRLDLNSEGLLLLTNDGALKRRLELPSTGWLRKYRVRVHGRPTDATLAPLVRGLVIDGERFQSMEVSIDRQQGANAWLTIGLREGRNREIRRALMAVGLDVSRLIRISYGPFTLGEMEPGAVEEIRAKVLRDQLGIQTSPDAGPARARTERAGGGARGGRPGVKIDGKSGAGPGGKPQGGATRGAAGPGAGSPRRGAGPVGRSPNRAGGAGTGRGGAGAAPRKGPGGSRRR